MPELPEVETIVRGLRNGWGPEAPPLPGRRIVGVRVRWPGHIACPTPLAFRRRIRNRTILDIHRRGKFLTFCLDRGALLIHLKMSGDLVLAPAAAPRDRFERTVFALDDGRELRFNDARKFGRVYLVDDPQAVLGLLGPEPLEARWTAQALAEQLARRHRPLKPLLLDQTFVAGIGNIYADEALHRARLHPRRYSDTLQPEEIRRLWKAIRQALRSGLRHNGASLDWVYRGGNFQNHFRVYGRAGQPCRTCGTPITRIIVAQRSTHYCPNCQPEAC